jgi:hypothetical protein
MFGLLGVVVGSVLRVVLAVVVGGRRRYRWVGSNGRVG